MEELTDRRMTLYYIKYYPENYRAAQWDC